MLAIASNVTIAIAITGECVRASTCDSRSGMIRSNDQANMLRLISTMVWGSQMNRPTVKPMMITAPSTQLPEAMLMISG